LTQFDFAAASTARKSITLILGIILFTGTITSFYTSSSSSFIRNAQAQSVDNVLDDIDCDNINLNLNGNDISIDTLPQSLGGIADLVQTEAGDDGISNTEQKAIDDFIFKCINNNENEFSESQTPPPPVEEEATLSISKEWFVCNNEDIDCTIEVPEQQISFQGPNSGNYIQCTSDGQCPFANDAGFNIEITGNSPTPNTIPAQINTEQQVQIGAGSFEVSEQLFSNRFVPNAIFDVENVPVGQDIIFSFLRHFIEFDETGQRVFTANTFSNSISIIDLTNSNNVTNVPLFPSGGVNPSGVVFDDAGQRVFTPNLGGSVSIIDLANSNNVTNVPLGLGTSFTFSLAFDAAGQRVFTANEDADSVSIIDLANSNTVTNVPLISSGGDGPRQIAFDAAGQRVFTANVDSNSVSIIDLANSNNVTNVPLAGGDFPVAIAFDAAGQRVFTANLDSNSISIIDLANSNNVTNVPSGGIQPNAIAFDAAGQRLFTPNAASDSVSIIDLANSNNVTNIPLGLGGSGPIALVFDETGQRVFTANVNSNSISIIDLATSNNVTNIPLAPSGGISPVALAFDEAGHRVFTANANSDSVSIIDLLSLPTVANICQESGFDTGDIRTFESNVQTLQQISCVNFVGQCSGNIDNGETRECTVEDYIVSLDELPTNGQSGIVSSMNNSQQQNQLFTNDMSNTKNKIKTQALPTGPFIYEIPKH